MKPYERFVEEIRSAVANRPLASVATSAGLPRDAIRSVLTGHDPRLSRVIDLADALGLEFYIGPPRPLENLYSGERNADTEAISPPILDDKLRDLESHTQGLARIVATVGGDPIPDDLWPVLAARREAAPPKPATAEIIEFPVAADDDDLYRVAEEPPAYKSISDPTPDTSAARPVDVVEIAAAAGGGATELDERATGCVWFRRDWLDRNAIDPTQSIVISVHGESMEPLLPDGSSVLVDRTRRLRSAGRVFVLQTSTGLVVKRLERQQGVWQLMSEHPDWAPMPWTDRTEIIGEVRWTARTLE